MITIDITVPTDIVQAVAAWRNRQLVSDGQDPPNQVPKYANNIDLLRFIIKDAIQRIIDQEPTASIQTELDKIKVAKSQIKVIRDGVVT